MMKAHLILVTAAMFASGCKEKNKTGGDECSIKLPEIHFTKSLNKAKENSTFDNGRLTIKSEAKKDYFNDPDGKLSNNSAPVLLAKVNNDKPFTLSAKITPSFNATYDAGALYIYSTENLWQKFAFEKDEMGRTRIVSVRTIETSDDNNHDILTNSSVFMKISSDTRTVGFYYSIDNVKWNLARLYKNDYPSTIWVGLSAQSPVGNGTAAYFENCSLAESSIKDFRTGL